LGEIAKQEKLKEKYIKKQKTMYVNIAQSVISKTPHASQRSVTHRQLKALNSISSML
jgi:hypothetical protein